MPRTINDPRGAVKKALLREWIRWHCVAGPHGTVDMKEPQSAARRAGYGEDDLDKVMSKARGLFWWMSPEVRKTVTVNASPEVIDEAIKAAEARKKKG